MSSERVWGKGGVRVVGVVGVVGIVVVVRCLWGVYGLGAGGMIIEEDMIPYSSSRFEIPLFEINI